MITPPCAFIFTSRHPVSNWTPWSPDALPEGPRNLLGEDPILVGSHVSDLRTDEGKSAGEQIVRWTQRRDDNLTLVVSKEDELLGRLPPGKSA